MDSRLWMKCSLVAVLVGVFFFLGSAAFAQRTIVVAVDGDWPPMKMKDDQGNITGYEIDMIKAIAGEAGFQISIVEVPWDSILQDLNTGKYDAVIASVSITDQRKEKYDFSNPYFSAEQLLVIPKSLISKPLSGKSIAAYLTTTGAAALKKSDLVEKRFYPVTEMEAPFKDMAEGKIAGVLCDTPVAVHYAFFEAPYKGKFAIVGEDYLLGKSSPKEEYGIVVKKGNAETLDLMNKGLKSVKAKNLDTEIRMKWITW